MPDLNLLPGGMDVFVDTNIFDLHFQGNSLSCTNFLNRIANGEIDAYVNTLVLADLLHKLMTAEAYIKHFTISVLPINERLLVETKIERTNFYLMTGDSLHLGCMNRHTVQRRKVPLHDIVTHDSDF